MALGTPRTRHLYRVTESLRNVMMKHSNEKLVFIMRFQQDGATCHASARNRTEVASFFDTRLISKWLWPTWSPYLTAPNFFLCGMLTRKLYRNKPCIVVDLQENIQREITAVPSDILHTPFWNMERRIALCLA